MTRKVAPDGGWGWMATLGVSMVNLATRSIEPSFGLLFGDLLTSLDVNTTGAALIISGLDIMMNFSGLFVGPLLSNFSYRKVTIFGAILCAIGLASTYPAQSFTHIILTYSIINGIGVGLSTSAAFVALNHYFKKKRGQAVGLSMAGTALGMLVMPQLVKIVLELYDFRGSILLLSGVALNAVVGGMLLQPVKWHMKDEEIDVELEELNTIKEDEEDTLPEIKTLLYNSPRHTNIKKNFSEANMGTMGGRHLAVRPSFPRITSNASIRDMEESRKRKKSVISSMSQMDFTGSNFAMLVDIADDHEEEYNSTRNLRRVNTHLGMTTMNRDSFGAKPTFKAGSVVDFVKSEPGLEMAAEPKKLSFYERFIKLLDVQLLKDRSFLNLLFGLSIFYVAETNFKMITPFFLNNLGFSKSEVAYFLSITAVTDILARLIIPPICDKFNVSKRLVFTISIFFVGIFRSVVAEQVEWFGLVLWLSICGFFRGAALANFTLTVSEFCTIEKLPAAFGWHLIGKALFVIIFGPIIGAIRDYTGSFPYCIHFQSLCILMCCLAWIIEYAINRCRKPKTIAVMAENGNGAAK